MNTKNENATIRPGHIYLGEIPFVFDDIFPEVEIVIRARYFRREDGSIMIDLAEENEWASERIDEITSQIIADGKLEEVIERYRDE